MKTKLKIIEETVKYYSEDVRRRAVNGIQCSYITEDGRMCAVGRCLQNPKEFGEISAYDLLLENEDDIFKPEYQGHDPEFWEGLQKLHDNRKFWTTKGISLNGQDKVKELKERWGK